MATRSSKLLIAIALGLVGQPASAAVLDALPEQQPDEQQIEQLVSDATHGWDTFNVVAATAEYADDASWFNAFGRQRHGKAAIRELVGRILASPGYRSGKKSELKIDRIEFLRPDLALVHTTQDTLGQRQLDGTEAGPRRTHIFRIVQKSGQRWLTRVWIASDQRDGGTIAPEPSGEK